ncbi:conserved protein, unknown function [Hepatocystis sp. ex Piliocolobus tephrosceles]|nr:conserved protein, unknown function [Hepatocystis sp. ex Piliocolobus tephrosceles]
MNGEINTNITENMSVEKNVNSNIVENYSHNLENILENNLNNNLNSNLNNNLNNNLNKFDYNLNDSSNNNFSKNSNKIVSRSSNRSPSRSPNRSPSRSPRRSSSKNSSKSSSKKSSKNLHKKFNENVYENFSSSIHTNININENNKLNTDIEDNCNDINVLSRTEQQGVNSDINGGNNNGNNNNGNNNNGNNNNGGNNNGDNESNDDSNNYDLDNDKENETNEKNNLENDEEIQLAVKIALQILLKKQPIPIRRDDLFNILNMFVPNSNSSLKKKIIIEILNKHVNNILALNLLTLRTKTKTEYVLSQHVTYKEHNNLLLSNFDHNIRGFLIFLIPFFKAFHNKLPFNYLLYVMNNIGHKINKTKEEIITTLKSPLAFANVVNNINLKKELIDPSDYLIYCKRLSYIDFMFDQSDINNSNTNNSNTNNSNTNNSDTNNSTNVNDNISDSNYCIPTKRYEQEINTKQYINDLLNIANKKVRLEDLYMIFDDNQLMNQNCQAA